MKKKLRVKNENILAFHPGPVQPLVVCLVRFHLYGKTSCRRVQRSAMTENDQRILRLVARKLPSEATMEMSRVEVLAPAAVEARSDCEEAQITRSDHPA